MPLLDFWKSAPQTVDQLTIEQVVANAGDGVLRDDSSCSYELREYLAQLPSGKISTYVEHCLSAGFAKSGMVLQDLINELGQGTAKAIGFDGIWLSPEQHNLIVEVKTTDAYRISLDTIAGYRDKLVATGQLGGTASILIVVGREDTGELEAQVRGSRHAWDIRLISAEALTKLVQLKENAEGGDTARKIQSILTPMEYTRLDQLIEVMFTTAREVEAAVSAEQPEQDEPTQAAAPADVQKGVWQFTDSHSLQEKRDRIVATWGGAKGIGFIKRSRALYWNANHDKRLVCTISKRYTSRTAYPYWYAYHPQWDEFLQKSDESFLALGCMDLPFAFVIPASAIRAALDALNTTTTKDGQTYWHMHLVENEPGHYAILLPKRSAQLQVDAYRMDLPPSSDRPG